MLAAWDAGFIDDTAKERCGHRTGDTDLPQNLWLMRPEGILIIRRWRSRRYRRPAQKECSHDYRNTQEYDEVPTIPCKICGSYFKAVIQKVTSRVRPMSSIDKLNDHELVDLKTLSKSKRRADGPKSHHVLCRLTITDAQFY